VVNGRQQRIGIPLHPRNGIALTLAQWCFLITFQVLAQANDHIQRGAQFVRNLPNKIRSNTILANRTPIQACEIVWDGKFAFHKMGPRFRATFARARAPLFEFWGGPARLCFVVFLPVAKQGVNPQELTAEKRIKDCAS
jgi:hypothetical protein